MALPMRPPALMDEFVPEPFGDRDYELFERDGEFVLTVEMPGFEVDEIDVNWFDGRLNVSAERSADDARRERTYHRTFRFPKDVHDDGIEASYENGVLAVRLPIAGPETRGTPVEVEG